MRTLLSFRQENSSFPVGTYLTALDSTYNINLIDLNTLDIIYTYPSPISGAQSIQRLSNDDMLLHSTSRLGRVANGKDVVFDLAINNSTGTYPTEYNGYIYTPTKNSSKSGLMKLNATTGATIWDAGIVTTYYGLFGGNLLGYSTGIYGFTYDSAILRYNVTNGTYTKSSTNLINRPRHKQILIGDYSYGGGVYDGVVQQVNLATETVANSYNTSAQGMNHTMAMDSDSSGNLYVAALNNSDLTSAIVSLTTPNLGLRWSKPMSIYSCKLITVDQSSGNLYAYSRSSDDVTNKLYKLDPSNGVILKTVNVPILSDMTILSF